MPGTYRGSPGPIRDAGPPARSPFPGALTEDVPLIKTYNEKAWAELVEARTAPIDLCGLIEALGADHFFLSPHRAVKHILAGWGRLDDYLETVPGESMPVG